MKYLDSVTIIPSHTLSELHLDKLVGRTGKIIETHINGCWVKFSVKIMGEKEWFIPNSSII